MSELSQRDLKPRVLYCHCAYARVVPNEVKQEVLARLAADESLEFEAVPDLCEMSARKDPKLVQLSSTEAGPVQIAACYPRAVRWLFSAAGAALPESGVEIFNMREQSASEVVTSILKARS